VWVVSPVRNRPATTEIVVRKAFKDDRLAAVLLLAMILTAIYI